MIPPVTPVPETLSALVVERVLPGLLQYPKLLLARSLIQICYQSSICMRTVKCIVHWGVLMHVILVVRQGIPFRDDRRSKLRYLVHFSARSKFCKLAE